MSPIDYTKEMYGLVLFLDVKDPFIRGGDIAGSVVTIGPGVTRFKIGDRVRGLSRSASQQFLIVPDHLS